VEIDLTAARSFMYTHARLLDRRRFDVMVDRAPATSLLAALDAYRNPDGGYGWGLEPDLRSATSQPGGALHAFEAMADAAPATTPRAIELCDWLTTVTLPDGGLPFALPFPDTAGSAPFWVNADPSTSSLQITAFVTAEARRVAAHDPSVAAHPWLRTATEHCLSAVRALTAAPPSMELASAVRLLDAIGEPGTPGADLDRLRPYVPRNGLLQVAGGAEGEYMRPLDFAPRPDGPARQLIDPEAVQDDLRRLARDQRPDGGWDVDFDAFSAAAALEWRSNWTVHVLRLLRENAAS
jgi:hypothetical protein